MRPRPDLPPRMAHSLPRLLGPTVGRPGSDQQGHAPPRGVQDDEEGADNLRAVLGVLNGKPIPLPVATTYCAATALVAEAVAYADDTRDSGASFDASGRTGPGPRD